MKKLIVRTVIGLLLCAGIVFALVYTRPMTVADLCPGLDLLQCQGIRGYYRIDPDVENISFTLRAGDDAFMPLLAQFRERKFRRSLLSLLPNSTKIHPITDGDYKWELFFQFDDVILPDGSTVSSDLLHFNNFYGILELHYGKETWRCTTSDLDIWLSDVMYILSDL